MLSSEIDWQQRDEHFVFMAAGFDVDKAKRLIVSKPREIQSVDIPQLKDFVHPRTGLYAMRVTVDYSIVDSDALDLSIPVIVAELRTSFLPIDGWHRIARAIELGMPELPAVYLTMRESQACRT